MNVDQKGTWLGRSIAFVFPNEKGENEMEDYIVSIDEIEDETGLDFLDVLDDSFEDELEASTASSLWN
tara:strand:- start:206 stop:409 length:204 start_codon:yes stop_codon:yes gene_type:complete